MGTFSFIRGSKFARSFISAKRNSRVVKTAMAEGLEERRLLYDFWAGSITASSGSTPVAPGSQVTVDAKITFSASTDGASLGPVPTGIVTFSDGTQQFPITLTSTHSFNTADAVLTYTVPANTSTSDIIISATYPGDSNYPEMGSVGSADVHIASMPATPTVTLSDSTSGTPVAQGAPVTLTAVVSGSSAVPTGAVTFLLNGATAPGTGPVTLDDTGTASLEVSNLPIGTDSITAQYGGDSNYSMLTSSADSVTITAASATPTLTLALSSNAVATGAPVTLTAMVSGSGATPTGSVTFYSDSDSLADVDLAAGTATFMATNLSPGMHLIAFTYNGDANYANEASATQNLIVIQGATPTVSVMASGDQIEAGLPLTLTASVTGSAGAAPTGAVTFYAGGVAIDPADEPVTLNGATAALTTPDLPAGDNSITAQYSGDGNYSALTSAPVTVTVNVVSLPEIVIFASRKSAHLGQAVTFTAEVDADGAPESGDTVDFYTDDGATLIGESVSNSAGEAKATGNAGSDGVKLIVAQVTAADGTIVSSNVIEVRVSGRLHEPKSTDVPKHQNDTMPTFDWTPVDGATSYDVHIVDVTHGIHSDNAIFADVTGVPDASYTVDHTMNPEHTYMIKVRAEDGNSNDTSSWSEYSRFTIDEQATTQFRIRLLRSAEFSVPGLPIPIGGAGFSYSIQATTDANGRPALGPARIMDFIGPGLGVDVKLTAGFNGTSGWETLTTPTPMRLDDFTGAGDVILYPSVGFGSLGGLNTRETVTFHLGSSDSFLQYLSLSSTGYGITLLTTYAGKWRVLGYDKSDWPNDLKG